MLGRVLGWAGPNGFPIPARCLTSGIPGINRHTWKYPRVNKISTLLPGPNLPATRHFFSIPDRTCPILKKKPSRSLQLQPTSLLSASLSWSWWTPFCARWWSPLLAGGALPSRATLPASCPTTSCSPNTPFQLNTWSKKHDAQSKILSNWSKD